MERLRLLYLTHQYFPRHVGGTEVYTRGLAIRAQRAGHAVRVVTAVESPAPICTLVDTEHDGVPVTEVHQNLGSESIRLALNSTMVDMNGLNNSLKVSGTSRWNEIRRGTDIPPHDSFASGFHGLVDSVCRPPYLFSMQRSHGRSHTFQTLIGGAPEILYDTESESGEVCSKDPAAVVDSLRASLEAHLELCQYPER